MTGWTASRTSIRRWRAVLAGTLVTLGTGCAAPGVLIPTRDILRDVYLRGSRRTAAVALTFDDGPNGRCTEAVLDVLRDLRAPATFFVIGANVTPGRSDELLARMLHEGHTIGVHSQTHGVRPLFLRAATADELRQARGAVEAALERAGVPDAPPVRFFRPPFGFLTTAAARAAADAGVDIIEWTVSVEDWRSGQSAAEVRDRILAQVGPGDVIVLHDGDRTHQRSADRCVDRLLAAETVRLLVPALAARGLRVAPLATLLGLDAPASLTGLAAGQ